MLWFVLGCINEFEVGQCLPIYHGCAGLSSQVVSHVFCFLLVSSSLTAVVLGCGMCFVWVLRCPWLFYDVFGELFQTCV